jgi:uncharacterized membrane protein HdeD (DUF308 family)
MSLPPERWRTAVIAGALLAVIGSLAIVFPFVSGVSLSLFFGAALLVAAMVQIAHAFSADRWTGAVWEVVLAIVYAVGGLALLFNPVFGLATLTILLAAYLVVSGVFEIVFGVMARTQQGWWVVVLSGVIGILLGGLIWVGFPSSAAWALGLLFGVNLLASGISLAYLGFSTRSEAKRMERAAGAA